MTRQEVITTVNEVMGRGFEIPLEKLVPEAVLKTDLGLDSLDAVDMLVLLEEKLGANVDGDRLMQIKTLDDVYNLISEHTSNGGSTVDASNGTATQGASKGTATVGASAPSPKQ